MQLNKFTDYALRILLYTAREREQPYTIAEIAKDLHVSENHLIKVVHFMAKQNWLITTRGKGGGIRIAPHTMQLRLGQIIRTLEGDQNIVECHTPPCVLLKYCQLKGALQHALEQFYLTLDQYQLSDLIQHTSHLEQDKLATIALLQL